MRHKLVERHILAGVPIFPDLEYTLLLAFTEQNTRAEIDGLVDALREIAP
jgi:glycine cleavage system protein P-like pyridoxal-binding family